MKTISIAATTLAVLLAGCSSTPPVAPSKPVPATTAKSGGYYLDDGPEAHPPANLDAIPDAVPRGEPLHRFANRTYVALGTTYTPQTERRPYREEGGPVCTPEWHSPSHCLVSVMH
jgi:rare lipoprotein A